MLDKNDLNQIGTIIKENNKELTKEIVLQVGEFIVDRVLPQIDELSSDLVEVKSDLAEVKKTVTTLPNRDELARGLAEMKGESVTLVRKEDEKVDLHIKFSHENKVLTEEQRKALSAVRVFPMVEI